MKSELAVFTFLKTVVVLKTIVRQEGADQQAFRNCLDKFRMGAVGFVEYEFLRARINGIVDSFESRRFKDSLFLMHTPDEVDSYNAKQLLKLNLLGSHVMSWAIEPTSLQLVQKTGQQKVPPYRTLQPYPIRSVRS